MAEQTAPTQARPGAISALLLLLTINLFNYIDRQVLAAVEPPITANFGLTLEQAGLLASAFLYAYMIGAPICGRLAERMSRWWIIAISVTVWSLASGLTGLATSFGMLLFSRILVGFGEAGYGPAAPALIADYFPIEKRGKVMSLFYLALPVGSALGYVYGGWINEWKGWRWAFYLVVPPGLILASLCLLRREPARAAAPIADHKRSFVKDAKTLLRIPSYFLNTAAMTAMTFAIGGISFWIPKYMLDRIMVDRGLKPLHTIEQVLAKPPSDFMKLQIDRILSEVNFTFGIIVVTAGFISTILGGWLGDKLRKRWHGSYFAISGVAIALAFPCTLGMIWLPFPYVWFAVFGAVFFLFFNTGPANTALANVTTSPMRATAFALNIFLVHALGDAISPPLIGWIATQSSWSVAFVSVSLMMVVASVLWLIAARYLGRDEAAALREEELAREKLAA